MRNFSWKANFTNCQLRVWFWTHDSATKRSLQIKICVHVCKIDWKYGFPRQLSKITWPLDSGGELKKSCLFYVHRIQFYVHWALTLLMRVRCVSPLSRTDNVLFMWSHIKWMQLPVQCPHKTAIILRTRRKTAHFKCTFCQTNQLQSEHTMHWMRWSQRQPWATVFPGISSSLVYILANRNSHRKNANI